MPASHRQPLHIDRRRGRARRHGYLYVAVLFTSLLVAASVAAALSRSTAILRRQDDRADRLRALRLAESELQRLAAILQYDVPWREYSTNGEFSSWRTVSEERHQVRHRLTDPDGDLADNPFDPVELTVHARVGSSEAAVAAELESRPEPIEVLGHAVTVEGDIEIKSEGRISATWPIQCGDDCQVDSAAALTAPRIGVVDDLDDDGMVRGDRYRPSFDFPDPKLLELYREEATELSVWSLSSRDGRRWIEEVVISDGVNPYGPTDAEGRYWIDAENQHVVIRDCRLDATLVITDANSLTIAGGVHWSAPAPGGAALLTDSRLQIEDLAASLEEAAAGANFNPAGAPDRAGTEDNDLVDSYPTEILGLIYTPRHLTVRPTAEVMDLRIQGSVLCRRLDVRAPLTLMQADEQQENPPLGFRDPLPKQFVRGSIRRVASP